MEYFSTIKNTRRLKEQRGETQLGLIVGALVLGSAIAIGSFVTEYMSDTKDERGQKTREYFNRLDAPPEYPVERSLKGYSVTIK